MADTRSENAEMDIGRLNVRIDKVDFLNEGDISSFFCLIRIFVCLIEMDIFFPLSPPQNPTKVGRGPSNGEVQDHSHNILDHFCRLSLKITLATILITSFLKCHIKGGGRPGGGEVQDQAGLRRPQRCL